MGIILGKAKSVVFDHFHEARHLLLSNFALKEVGLPVWTRSRIRDNTTEHTWYHLNHLLKNPKLTSDRSHVSLTKMPLKNVFGSNKNFEKGLGIFHDFTKSPTF